MESALAQDCVIAAQEDSTSVNIEVEVLPPTAPADKIINDDSSSLTIEELSDNLNSDNMGNRVSSESDPLEIKKTENSFDIDQEENSGEIELNDEKLESHSENELSKFKEFQGDSLRSSLPISRKRPATDFLPISGEIKKIGVEISEEEAQQLKNEVRRLSPIHVSLRERTLGEISLISEPRVFVDDNVKFMKNDDDDDDTELSSFNLEEENLKINEIRNELINSRSENLVDNSRVENCVVTEGSVDKKFLSEENSSASRSATDLNECGSFVESVPTTSSTENSKGLRELVLVLSRVDAIDHSLGKNNNNNNNNSNNNNSEKVSVETKNLDKSKNNDDEEVEEEKETSEPEVDSSRTLTSEGMGLMIERCISYVQEQASSKNEMFLVEKLEKNEELSVGDRITSRKMSQVWEGNKELGVSGVIEKIEVDEEIIFSNSSLGIDEIQTEDVGENPLGLESIGLTSQIQEAVDTEETETETGSDSSEVTSSMTAVQFGVDHHVISNQISCSENDTLICDDIAPDIMTRLEPERPEAFTEDSAESLALAAGSRDEVRSDGSDSGLGSEIPGDSGPAPAPESDSETSFLDRIPDEILSDKDKSELYFLNFNLRFFKFNYN